MVSAIRILFLFLFLKLMLFSVAQKTDSIEWLNERCWELAYSQPDSAIYFCKLAKIAAIREQDTHQAVRSDILTGIVYDVKAQYDSAMLYYHQSLKSSKALQDTFLIAASLSNIGLTFWHVGSYYKALENFFASLRYFETLSKSNPNVANVYNNIGMIYSELEELGKSLDYLNKAAGLYLQKQDTIGLGAVLTNIAIHYKKKGNVGKALVMIDSAIKIKKRSRDYYGLAIGYNQKAEILKTNNQMDEAYEALLNSLNYSMRINDQSAQAATYQLLHDVFLFRGEYDKALRYNNMAYKIALKINDKKLLVKNFENLSEIFRIRGDYQKAYENYVRYTELKDSLIQQKQLSNIYELEFQHQLDKQQHEIVRLQEQQELQDLKIESQQLKLSKRNLQLILIITVSIILLLLFYLLYMKDRHRHKREMVETIMQQKSRQAQKIIQAELSERKRISQEIHDSLGQLLSLIKMNLSNSREKSNGSNNPMTSKIDEILKLVDHAIIELRHISQNMSPLKLREKGLQNAIRDMVQRLRNSGNVEISLQMLDLEKLNDELIENIVFSVVQESLNNAIKHSQCSRIDIQMVNGEDEITVMVEDDGTGFDESKVAHGLGIKQIRTKIKNIGGQVDIDSMTGRGTIVSIEIPTKKIFEV